MIIANLFCSTQEDYRLFVSLNIVNTWHHGRVTFYHNMEASIIELNFFTFNELQNKLASLFT
jgi:hypothetical protein